MTAAERYRCLEKRFGLFGKSETVGLSGPLFDLAGLLSSYG